MDATGDQRPTDARLVRPARRAGRRLGLGREGSASLRKLRELGVEPVLVDDTRTASRCQSHRRRRPRRPGRLRDRPQDPGHQPLRTRGDQLRQAGVILVGGLGLWLQEADRDRVVCVTGTKGKSTTSSIIGHLLTGLGYRALVGGNFGAAPYDPQHAGDYDYWVIEVSSYTATDLASTPPVTAVTSLHPDHLPWHGGVEHYYRDKLSACSQPGAELTVANGDSALLRERAACSAPKVEWVSSPTSRARPGWTRSGCRAGTTAATR